MTKEQKCLDVLDLMREHEVSIKDLSFVIAEFEPFRSLPELQKAIKGFLYPDPNIVEPKI